MSEPAKPRWATPRTPERQTLGIAALRVSRLLKQPLMPWQRGVLDVAMELLDDGRFAYRNVILTIPRQQGKTTALLAMIVARALLEHTRVAYCAQSALDARKKWREDWMPAIQGSPVSPIVEWGWGPGDEKMTFVNGSQATITASTEKAGHGMTDLDVAIVDEAFAYHDSRLEQALRPAMMTMPNAQLWVVSTAGTPLSTYLRAKVTSGRQFVEDGRNRGTCYFEWSAPDNADPEDPATWRTCMPALGRTITEEIVAEDYQSFAKEGKLHEFERAYLNRWVAATGDPVVPIDLWRSLAKHDPERPEWVVLALDVAMRDASASIVAAGQFPSGGEPPSHLQTSVLESGEGTEWLISALEGHCKRYDRPFVLVDDKHCAHLVPEIERVAGFDRVIRCKTQEIVAASAFWLRMVSERHVFHRGEPELLSALVGAGQRTVADGWAFSRAKSGSDITPLVAQMLAVSFWMNSWEDANV